jgi:hypothetical protein
LNFGIALVDEKDNDMTAIGKVDMQCPIEYWMQS